MLVGTPVDQGHNQSAATPTSLSTTVLSQINPGDFIGLTHYANSNIGPISSVVDSGGNTLWAAAASIIIAPVLEFYFVRSAVALAPGATVTANFTGAALRHAISVFSVPIFGAATIDVLTNSATGTATGSATLTYPTLAQAEELAILVLATGNAPGAVTWGGGFTGIGGNTATGFALPAYLVTSDPTSFTAAPSWINSILYRSLGVAFKITPPPPAAPTPSGGGGAVVGGRRRQILGREKPQAESRWTRETPPQVIKPTARQSGTTPQSHSIEDVKPAISSEAVAEPGDKHIKRAPTVRKPAPKVAKPSGPTWADMERARVELTRLRQELAVQQDEDDVELLLVSLH